MDYYLVIYKVTLDHSKNYYGKAGVASCNFYSDWELVKVKIYKGYRTSFPDARHMEIEAVKCTRVSLQKYNAFVSIAKGVYN